VQKFPKILIIWVSVLVVIVLTLYTPWYEKYEQARMDGRGYNRKGMSAGYFWIWDPPKAEIFTFYTIDFGRLGLEYAAVVFLCGAALITVKK
jgi:hypothetical protein